MARTFFMKYYMFMVGYYNKFTVVQISILDRLFVKENWVNPSLFHVIIWCPCCWRSYHYSDSFWFSWFTIYKYKLKNILVISNQEVNMPGKFWPRIGRGYLLTLYYISTVAPWVATTVALPGPAPVARGPHGPPNHCY